MKTWTIPVIWQMFGKVQVEANTLAEAIEIAGDKNGVIPLPDKQFYLDGSWELACWDENTLRYGYNDGQTDATLEDIVEV